MADRYRHANALPLGYRARRALLAVLIASAIAVCSLAVIVAFAVIAMYLLIAVAELTSL